jgi:hypothetical protein
MRDENGIYVAKSDFRPREAARHAIARIDNVGDTVDYQRIR